MSSSQHVFDENDEDNEDMEDPPENPAMLQEDLQTSSADHIAGAGGPAAFFQQQLPGQNMMQPTVASNSYPGQAPQSTTTPTSAQISGSAGPVLNYATTGKKRGRNRCDERKCEACWTAVQWLCCRL